MAVTNTNLLQYGNNYSHKKFYSTGPRLKMLPGPNTPAVGLRSWQRFGVQLITEGDIFMYSFTVAAVAVIFGARILRTPEIVPDGTIC